MALEACTPVCKPGDSLETFMYAMVPVGTARTVGWSSSKDSDNRMARSRECTCMGNEHQFYQHV
ncbi:hypothetical protein M378DRAFT_14694 [Amanita muscaria Koide BX008]|uniref:Uncharacterized protein n=1 Tax=Amanita muscaria (strain Koide BX008) TaxID=946122 RepID=A0A0C2WDX8_AMAMK|nr:hypothetical protein M378DRAFT_14694 [Amanita muscaria Koide BX008]